MLMLLPRFIWLTAMDAPWAERSAVVFDESREEIRTEREGRAT